MISVDTSECAISVGSKIGFRWIYWNVRCRCGLIGFRSMLPGAVFWIYSQSVNVEIGCGDFHVVFCRSYLFSDRVSDFHCWCAVPVALDTIDSVMMLFNVSFGHISVIHLIKCINLLSVKEGWVFLVFGDS